MVDAEIRNSKRNNRNLLTGRIPGIAMAILWSAAFVTVRNGMEGIAIGLCLGIPSGIASSLMFRKNDPKALTNLLCPPRLRRGAFFSPWQGQRVRGIIICILSALPGHTDADTDFRYGEIADVMQTGANDVYIVKGTDREYLVPAIPDVVISTDIDSGIMIIRPLEGLFDL